MGKRGTKNTAVSIHKERGVYREDRHGKGLKTRAINYIPKHPDTLNEIGQKLWYEFFGYASQIEGYVAPTEIGLMEVACQAWQEYRELYDAILTEGNIIVNTRGDEMINPKHKLMTAAQDRYIKIMREMGMTPTTRSGVSLIQDKPLDEWEI